MAEYPAPTENPPIFNLLDFIHQIDETFLDENFLRLKAQGDEDMNGNGITNMKSGGALIGTANAANMDDVAAGGSGVFLPLAGGTMAGIINMSALQIKTLADGTAVDDAVALQQLDNYLLLSGTGLGTMLGNIDMGTSNLLMDDTSLSLGSTTGEIQGSGIGLADLVVDGNNTSFGTAQFTTTGLVSAVDVKSFIGNNLRINGQYKIYLRNTSGQAITFIGNATAPWTGGMRCGTIADLIVPNGREAIVEIDVWSALFSVVNFYSIR
tara:strand:+ start:5146 stop:5946 length:801 start_codon:yes stop_codon:yes gene_type:complete